MKFKLQQETDDGFSGEYIVMTVLLIRVSVTDIRSLWWSCLQWQVTSEGDNRNDVMVLLERAVPSGWYCSGKQSAVAVATVVVIARCMKVKK